MDLLRCTFLRYKTMTELIIGFLIAKGTKISERDAKEGYTPLHTASLYGSKKKRPNFS